jgi:hypothetical protein
MTISDASPARPVARRPAVAALLAALCLAACAAPAAAGGASASIYGTMYGQAIPTPLLVPPGLHPRFLTEPVHTVKLASGLVTGGQVWTVTSGYPATLEGISPGGQVAVSLPLPGAYGADAIAAGPGGSVWVGTNPKGVILRYDPATGKVERVTALPGVNTVWSMVYNPADGEMWAATYPDGIWTINPASGRAANVGALSGVIGARVLGLVGATVWAGTYPTRAAFPLPAVGLAANILPAALSGAGQMVAVGPWSGGTAVLEDNGDLIWLTPSGALVGVLSDVASLPLPFDGQTVVLRDGGLWAVHLADHGHVLAGRVAQLPSPLAVTAVGVTAGAYTVLTPTGTIYTIRPGGRVSGVTPALSAQAGTIQTLAATPWGVWGSAYLGGQVFRLSATGTVASLAGLDQVDSIAACGGSVYLGVYPAARLYRYNPSAVWNPPANPAEVGSPGVPNDRVPGMACVGDVAYIGTVPGTGQLGGVVYTSTGRTLRPPVAGQTPISLAAWNGDLVGSLTDENALGEAGPSLPDHLFAYRPATGAWVTRALPSQAPFAGVIGTADGVFAASADQIARWNPTTGSLKVRTFRTGSGGDTGWGMGTHMFTALGRLYLVDGGWLYLVNPATLATKALFYGVEQVAVDGSRVDFSFYDGRWLLQTAASRLVPQDSVWPYQFWYIWRHDGHVWPAPTGKA